MGISSRAVHKIIEQKRKYWYKTLSDEAMWTILAQSYNVFDWLSFYSDWVISDTVWSSLVLSLLLDLSLTDIVPLNLLWDIQLPEPEEYARGVLIKLVPINIREKLKEIVPELEPVVESPEQLLEPEYQKNIEESKLKKGIYGTTSYGYSYYDPPAIREFLRSTILAFLKKDNELETSRLKIEQSIKTLKVREELGRMLFNRLTWISAVKEQALTWDYGWWDRTYWGEEGSEGKITTINYDLETVKLPYEDMIELQLGGYWDEAYWDYFYWTEEIPEQIHPYDYEKFIKAVISSIIHDNFRSRLSTTALAVANYQTRREREKWTESERLETYALPVLMRYRIENIVSSILRKYNIVNPIEARLYKTAILRLFGALGSPHKWGEEMFRAMSDEELKNWWIERWSREGLRRDILEEIFNKLFNRIKTYNRLREKERLRFLRKRLLR